MKDFVKVFIAVLLSIPVRAFKLPSVKLNSKVSNVHDQFSESIVNSTVTSINLSAIHIGCEIILLILIICAYKRLSSIVHELSLQFLRLKAQLIVRLPSQESMNAA